MVADNPQPEPVFVHKATEFAEAVYACPLCGHYLRDIGGFTTFKNTHFYCERCEEVYIRNVLKRVLGPGTVSKLEKAILESEAE